MVHTFRVGDVKFIEDVSDNSVLIVRAEDFEKFRNFSDDELIEVAQHLDGDFYTNDGWNIQFCGQWFEYSYDDGYRSYEVLKF